MSSRVIVALRVAAAPERAFEVFTRDIALWWKPNMLFAFTPRGPGVLSFEPGPGGRLIETREGGKTFEIGRIETWEPPQRLVFSWRQATFSAEQNTLVEVRFEAIDAQTRVTVTHSGWASVPATHVARHGFPDEVFMRRHGEWWQSLLVDYKEILSSRNGEQQ